MVKLQESEKICQLGLEVIETEAAAIQALISRIDNSFAIACEHLLACEGRIVVIGMGKSGHIGSKIAATLASTGSPAFFVHPGEANHGDAGMITTKDVVLALSNSGETSEILTLLPVIKRLDVPFISITGNPESTLAQQATVNLDVSVEKEACPLGLAPTSSTTATLVMGDALAIALLETRGFTAEDFAFSHPGGALGRRLLLYVNDIMHSGSQIPTVSENTQLKHVLVEMSAKRLGMTTVIDDQGKLAGIYTDGDLRRTIDQDFDIQDTPVHQVMSRNCKTIRTQTLAIDALQVMEKHKITTLVVVDETHQPVGVVHMHDILSAGIN